MSRVVILANDVVPGMGLPVAAPGLRAWGLALGLRAHGHEVTVIVDERVAGLAWRYRGGVPPAQPRGTLTAPVRAVADYCRTHSADALVMTNSNHVGALDGDLDGTRLVYDFFAPKMLELAEQAPPERREDELARLQERKLAALSRSDAVIVNGAKKLPYVQEWVARSGRAGIPVEVVTMPLPPVAPRPAEDGPIRAVVSGYLQPWSILGPWAAAIRPMLDAGRIELHILVGTHWGSGTPTQLPRSLMDLTRHPGVRRHPPLRFHDFRELLASCHLSIDVFERNPERELAMVTRSVVALSCGLPVLHVPFTEVSEIIRAHHAGWLVEESDVAAMEAVFEEAVADPDALAARRAGAVEVSHEVLEPAVATAPLAALLDGPLARPHDTPAAS